MSGSELYASTTSPPSSSFQSGSSSNSSNNNNKNNYHSNQSNQNHPNNYKVLFQKVVRPPPQLQQKDSQQNQLLLFLPSLVHYLQSTYTLPSDLPMIYNLQAIENEQEEDNDEDNDGTQQEHQQHQENHLQSLKNKNEYSILEIKSPLVSINDHRFHLFVEVIGIYTGGSTDSNGNENKEMSFPSMAMVVVKTIKPNHSSQHDNKTKGNDVIRSRLFQDSMQKIIQSIDLGLDSYMSGNVPLMIDQVSSSSNSKHNTKKKNDASHNNDDDDEDGTWIGLDEYEGFSKDDTWEELEPMISTAESLMGSGNDNNYNNARNNWDKDVVIDTVATTNQEKEEEPLKQYKSEKTKEQRKISNDEKKQSSTSTSSACSCSSATTATTGTTDYAILAAQEAMTKKKESMKTDQSNTSSVHPTRNHDTSTIKSGGGGGDFAVEAAKRLTARQQEGKEESLNSNNDIIEDYAVEAAKRIAMTDKSTPEETKELVTSEGWDESTLTTLGSDDESTLTTSGSDDKLQSSTEPDISHGDSMDLEDRLPKLSPMITNRVDAKSKSFRVSISKPEKFSQRKNRKKKLETMENDNTHHPSNDGHKVLDIDPSFEEKANETSQNTRNTYTDHTMDGKSDPQRKELNIVNDRYTADSNNEVSEQDRQKILNNLHLQSFASSMEKAPVESTSTVKKTKTTEEIQQDIYKAALDIMPGAFNPTSQDNQDSQDDSNSLTAEELLRDVLKFGEEKEMEEKVGTGFVEGAFSKAKELMSVETKSEQRIDNLQYKEAAPSSAEDELKRIFEAGQSFAEGRITQSAQVSSSEVNQEEEVSLEKNNDGVVSNEYIDELIGADKTISRNVRSLDDELAELELRVSRSPDETSNEGTNAIFDVFSGPEVYNPNVDPESSVNWPGATPGSRTDINLPASLKVAVKNARYASRLLSKIIEQNVSDNEMELDVNIRFFIDGKEISKEQIRKLQRCVEEGVSVGLIDDPFVYMSERSRLDMVVDELMREPDERFGEIIVNYKDLLLSDNFVSLVKEKIQNLNQPEQAMSNDESSIQNESKVEQFQRHEEVRSILGKLIQYAQLLLKEARALGAELEVSQLEIIRSICKVAMDPSHETEEETSLALTDAVRDLKPLLDENFVAYLKYAVAEEEGRLARAGLLNDPEHNRWLFVLKIVQEGVYAELSKGVQRYIDHIGYVLRMDTKAERRMLLSQLIDVMPSMDVRPFVRVVENIASSLGAGSKGDFDATAIDSYTNQILQLRHDVNELLPPERIKAMSKDADDWAARRRKKLLEQRGVSQQRLKAARESEDFDDAVRRGEIERFD